MNFRIHRMKDATRQSFKWAAHTGGQAAVKPRDYEQRGQIEAASPYSAWSALLASGDPLQVGDLLEDPDGRLRIFKYVGFEEAKWVLPEVSCGMETIPPAAGAGGLPPAP